MRLIDGIQRFGFRKWYERELLKSHAHLTLTFLCAVAVFAAVEAALTFRSLQDQIVDALAIVAAGAIGIWALRRYLYLLMHAEFVANQADCPRCGVYARFKLAEPAETEGAITVCCRDCAHQWAIRE
ncbi:MAG: hypothetical protein JNJ42_03250 [Burkholderiaceae bacterium]|nr:hypothetical protein [Burkholderiaceae bacterium]